MRLAPFNENLPQWIKENISSVCPYCEGYFLDNDEFTLRKCSNAYCPGHLAHKMDKLLKSLGVKDFGPATALDYITQFHLTSHLQILKFFFPNKPSIPLYKVGEYAMIHGIDKAWQTLVSGFSNMAEFTKSSRCPANLRANAEYLNYVESFFNVEEPLEGQIINVMLSGSIDGYNNRRAFIGDLNQKYGHHVQLIDVGKRKTNVDYLIKEPWTVDHEKSNLAAQSGIPILSSKELVEKIIAYVAYINEKEEKEEKEEEKEKDCEVTSNED